MTYPPALQAIAPGPEVRASGLLPARQGLA